MDQDVGLAFAYYLGKLVEHKLGAALQVVNESFQRTIERIRTSELTGSISPYTIHITLHRIGYLIGKVNLSE